MSRRPLIVALVLLVPLVISACTAGQDDSGGTSPRTTGFSSEAAPIPRAKLGKAIARASQPVDIATHPASQTMYVVERGGTVRLIGSDGLGPVVLDVSGYLEPNSEEGLLGFAFAPDGSKAWLNEASRGRTSIVEYTLNGEGTFDAASRRVVYGFDQPYDNHNGGALLVGPDGLLYIFSGDGGYVADPDRTALDLTVPLGKVLRIDPTPGTSDAYSVPLDNPFVGEDDALPEIWAYGLRNPWRASFDSLTGDLWIGDVGDFAWEEINVAWADEGAGRGMSFGWSAFEGTHRYNKDQSAEGHKMPFYEYAHGEQGCSISAGTRYRGDSVENLAGWFVFADFCSGKVWALEVLDNRAAGRIVELGEAKSPVAVTAGPDGEIFVVSFKGEILPIVDG